ncbi:MAG TPA: recombinase family protein [Clostridiaceae bacterium]|jgi:site-specific DNA recombinase|nr:recombinase family protein [Clostridiaceae bacterium]
MEVSLRFGYDIVNKEYVINEKEAKVVRKIFDMRQKGYSLIDISVELNKLGYKTKRGTEFKKNSLYDLLKNEKYIGNYIYGKGTKDDHRNLNENMIRHEGTIPAIISKEVFEAVNKKKEDKKESTASKNFYLLTGLIKCGECGSTYTGTTQTTKKKNGKVYKNQYYRCVSNTKIGKCNSRMIKKELIEEKVVSLLTKQLLNNETIDTIVNNVNNEYKKGQKDFAEDIELMQKNIDKLEKEANKLVDLCCQGFGTKKISDRLKEIEEKQEYLKEEIKEKKLFVENDFITPEKVRKALKMDISSLNLNSQKELKKLIQKWIIKIELTTTEAIVYFDLRRL